jgi:hypothetical protein
MQSSLSIRRRTLALALAGATMAGTVAATRVGSGAAPAASAVQVSVQQPRHVQTDETASLRQGTITAVDQGRSRIQVQGIWLEISPDATHVLRGGRRAPLDTLKACETIRFTVSKGTTGTALAVRLIYAP